MSHSLTKEKILESLRLVKDAHGQDVVSSGMVTSIVIKDGRVGFALEVPPVEAKGKEALRQQCEEAVAALEGVHHVTAVLTASMEPAPTPSLAKKGRPTPQPLPGVKNIIVVASGKGGVGKSTVAAHLAVSLAAEGLKVGLVDADIHGPSIPRMLGLKGSPTLTEDKKMIPPVAQGVKAISIGLLMDEAQATIWRGPMVTKALYQLLRGTAWGELDYLLIDMPPGTGDIHLSVADAVPITGAVLVSTPQDIALIDAQKAITMFQKTRIPILGMIENMSYFEDAVSGNRSYIFGKGGAERLAKRLEIHFLGEIPLLTSLREACDAGKINAALFPSSIVSRLEQRVGEVSNHS